MDACAASPRIMPTPRSVASLCPADKGGCARRADASSVLHYAPWGHLQGQSGQLLRGSREHRRPCPLRTSVLTPFSSPFGEAHYFRASRSACDGCRASSRDCVHRSSAKNQQRGASSCRTPTPVVENTSAPSAGLAAPAIVEEFIA